MTSSPSFISRALNTNSIASVPLPQLIEYFVSENFDLSNIQPIENTEETYSQAQENTWFYIKNIGWFKNQSTVIKGGSIYSYDIKDIKDLKNNIPDKMSIFKSKQLNSYDNVMFNDEIDEN